MTDQPNPTPNNEPAIVDLVIDDLRARATAGRAKYGTFLQAFNGRDALRDAYEESLDKSQYLKQSIIERDALIDRLVNAEKERDGALEICDQVAERLEHAAQHQQQTVLWRCGWCGKTVGTLADPDCGVERGRQHSQECEANPLVKEVARLKAELEQRDRTIRELWSTTNA